jgi:threonine dehydratase
VASAVKLINPRVKVYGVQAEGAPAIARSFAEKKLVTTDSASTIADGIAVKFPGDLAVELINKHADGVVTVSDNEIANAILLLIERCKEIVEPAGATPLAAVLSGKIDVRGKRVVCLMSGGNIDVSFVSNLIERGLVARGRRLRFSATLIDRPGSLVHMLNAISGTGANILSVEHDKISARLGPNETAVHVVCEVGGKEHAEAVIQKLAESGIIAEQE